MEQSLEQKSTNFETTKHIMVVQRFINGLIKDLLDRSQTHDQSKLRSEEVDYFVEFTPKLKETTYGSEEYKSFLKSMKPALDHHYANNRHHPEHYQNGIKGMSLIDLLEMIVDWMAAAMRHGDGDVRKSVSVINKERFGYGDELEQILLNTVDYVEKMGIDLDTWSQKK